MHTKAPQVIFFFDRNARRRTIHQFSERLALRPVIEDCLLTAGIAPNGANLQPWHFVVVSNPCINRWGLLPECLLPPSTRRAWLAWLILPAQYGLGILQMTRNSLKSKSSHFRRLPPSWIENTISCQIVFQEKSVEIAFGQIYLGILAG
jgi:hypothetical protein